MPKDYWIACGQFLESIGKPAAWKCPNYRHQPIGDEAELLSGYWLKHEKFLSILSEAKRFCSYLIKVKEQWKIVKTLRWSSLIFALSIHTTLAKLKLVRQSGVCSTSLRSLYLWCGMSTNQKIFSSRTCYFFTKK